MSWVMVVCTVTLVGAIALIEVRAIREGDERRHHAPGYMAVLAGLVLIVLSLAAA